MKLIRPLTTLLPAAFLILGAAAPASALDWHPIADHDGMVLATCDDGSEILSRIPEGRFSERLLFDREGNPTGMVLMLKYSLDFVHPASGGVIQGTGNAHLVFDYVDGVMTGTGNQRTVSIAGEGWVLKEVGRVVVDLESGDLGFAGILEGEVAKLCPFFGVEG